MKIRKDGWLIILILFMSISASHGASWTAWGKSSSCSRSCGGGVKSRERLCVEDGTSRKCKGKKVAYRLCNTQECEDKSEFRAAQCEEHNGTPLDGVLYKWKPYYGHGQTCKLLCYAEGFEFYHELANKVIDGTSCHFDGHHICVNGSCKSVGCDDKIGSKKRVDACGICGGDNSTCVPSNEVTGTFEIPNLSKGYSTVLEIPVGATNIHIRDLGENRNPLEFWDSTRNTLRIDDTSRRSTSTKVFAGTSFTYTPNQSTSGRGRITASGPTDRPITLYVVNKGHPNRGLKYGYTLPRRSSKEGTIDLRSKVKQPENIRLKEVPVVKEASVVDQYLEQLAKPEISARIQLSKTDENFLTSSSARSEVRIPSRSSNRVPVRPRVEDQDHQYAYFHSNQNRYSWAYGDWTPCSNGCGTGIQRRVISCVDRVERKPTDSYFCEADIRPSPTQPCTNMDCNADSPGSYVQWRPGTWGPCSTTCELGIQTQQVSCMAVYDDGTMKTVGDELCINQYKSKPQYRRSCNEEVSCDRSADLPRWRFSAWSQCSVPCGRGQQTRRVDCRSRSDMRLVLPDSFCEPELRPVSTKACFERECGPREIRYQSCRNSYYGCCPDGYTGARGPNNLGCPEDCWFSHAAAQI